MTCCSGSSGTARPPYNISASPGWPPTLPQALFFFSEKWPPYVGNMSPRKLNNILTFCVALSWVTDYGSLLSYRFLFWDHFWILIALLGVRRGLKMILSQRAPSSLNMSPYRAIWSHFRPNYMIFGQTIPKRTYLNFRNPQIWKSRNPEIGPYSSERHFSESCSPRKMMQNGIDEIFWGQTFRNTPYFTLSNN